MKQRVHEEANLLWMIMCDGNGERSEYAMCAIFSGIFGMTFGIGTWKWIVNWVG